MWCADHNNTPFITLASSFTTCLGTAIMFIQKSFFMMLSVFIQACSVHAFLSGTPIGYQASLQERSRKVVATGWTQLSYSSYQSPQGQEWINKSIEYYTKVMRKEKASSDEQSRTAKRLYHAIQQIRSGNLNRAESIYRKTISDLKQMASDEDDCRAAELATTTLLLALVLQRMGNVQETRLVYHRFFRKAMEKDPSAECACTAKVLGAYAMFEMKYGSEVRSYEVARRATQFDEDQSKLLRWKQFRDAKERVSTNPSKPHHSTTPTLFSTEVNLQTKMGLFRLRSYRSKVISHDQSKFTVTKPCVIYYAPLRVKGKTFDLPIRIAFGNPRCKKCQDQLDRSMKYIKENGGAIICFRPQRSSISQIAHEVGASVLHRDGLTERSTKFEVQSDAENCIIASILVEMGVESIRLISHGADKVRRLRELGVDVRGTVPLT